MKPNSANLFTKWIAQRNHRLPDVVKILPSLTACLVLLLCSGCAEYLARKKLEGVAKGWCETIRASQVIPVYPLTEDLVPGDVFLVQTTIASQASLYKQKGFLALDDHRTRLAGLHYDRVYFDGYWKDDFGKVPHERIKRPNAGAIETGGSNQPVLTEVITPRAAFPTYSFASKSGMGLALAIPIQGIPVGLSFLHSDSVNGSVTIADARTYAADEGELYRKLREWTERPDVRPILSETVEKAGCRPVFLRAISRVYLTGAVIVSLSRADATGASGKFGAAPNVPMTDPSTGDVNANYQNLLSALDQQANSAAALTDIGGAVKFSAASQSSVALAESFDRLLVIGYLGFDVPVYSGGDLGVPIPTFQRLTGQLSDPPAARVGPLTIEQSRFRLDQDALEALAAADRAKALAVIGGVLDQLPVIEFQKARKAYESARQSVGQPGEDENFKSLMTQYKQAASSYVTIQGAHGPRYTRYDEAFVRAYENK